ncbi:MULTISPECIES: aminodeoxychorismate synthase component I [unclassified Pseudonocardia]|uniref:aminodeoxychorismate synthase component I n=1 Tax=unclassified Pseudonocardia TaxID=2619320 RepID=UPI00095C3FD2|nr:aminodeoxychorismate synthase component I [Pseudonocardia sp. Ae707_Ps1]OLM18849.1 Para-aminobenzoate synthase [Pseudonocardia sp. Ae707_Ps1]
MSTARDTSSPGAGIRTLLVDNHDSFTYNLFHQLSRVNGCEPEVVRNDDPAWRSALLDGFDQVVLSPGPGTPHRPADVGICAELAAQDRVPVLGVCLGHQTIALTHGARVGRAPEPRHGRSSPVHHDGTGLFAGLPSPIEVVRYHSLAVTDLPAALAATAWTPDGVLMALRHRTLPLWGVQFHPESIGTLDGTALLRNFRDLTLRWADRADRPRRTPAPDRAATGRTGSAAGSHGPGGAGGPGPGAAPAGPGSPGHRRPDRGDRGGPDPSRRLRVLVERVPSGIDGEVAFDRLFRTGHHPFWLDSSRPGGPLGRLSAMGDASGPLGRTAEADVHAGTVTVTTRSGREVVPSPFLDWLERDLAGIRAEVPELPFDFAPGWVGYLGYELKAECGGEAVHRSPDPDASMVFCDRALVLDHEDGSGYLLALAECGDDTAARQWLGAAAATLAGAAGREPDPVPDVVADPAPVRLRHDRGTYLDLVRACQDEILDGETYEICLTNMVEAGVRLDPWSAYRRLRRANRAPFASFLHFGRTAVLSSSPERFLRIGRDGVVESKPIKGTRPRGASPAQDARLRAELATSEKDRAENLMIVDLVRHDLGRCAEVGSVVAGPVFDIESYPTVHQLVSTVRARLRPGTSPVAAVRSAFPGGSMTGAPKVRTMRILDRLEAGPRGVYSGAVGYLSVTGTVDLSIVIRTAVLSGDRLRYGVGGAVIALSDPAAEFEETAVKATPVLALLGAEFPGRAPGAGPPDAPDRQETPSAGDDGSSARPPMPSFR